MKIVLKTLDAKKIAIISSISVVLLSNNITFSLWIIFYNSIIKGAIITAFQNYYKKRKKQQEEIRLKSRSNCKLLKN